MRFLVFLFNPSEDIARIYSRRFSVSNLIWAGSKICIGNLILRLPSLNLKSDRNINTNHYPATPFEYPQHVTCRSELCILQQVFSRPTRKTQMTTPHYPRTHGAQWHKSRLIIHIWPSCFDPHVPDSSTDTACTCYCRPGPAQNRIGRCCSDICTSIAAPFTSPSPTQ